MCRNCIEVSEAFSKSFLNAFYFPTMYFALYRNGKTQHGRSDGQRDCLSCFAPYSVDRIPIILVVICPVKRSFCQSGLVVWLMIQDRKTFTLFNTYFMEEWKKKYTIYLKILKQKNIDIILTFSI